ncbi:MAG: hypothetical protein Kow0063_36450 [Anaerolineae bacterium]
MSDSRKQNGGRALIAGILSGVICILLAGVLPPLLTQAAPPVSTLPPRPTSVFPPRPTTPLPSSEGDEKDDEPIGAYIELQVRGAPDDIWAVVQWQDSTGAWHDVEGWRSTLDQEGRKTWWVAGTDFNKGPFRWVIYQNPWGGLLAKSNTFHLPGSAGETIIIKARLPQDVGNRQ